MLDRQDGNCENLAMKLLTFLLIQKFTDLRSFLGNLKCSANQIEKSSLN